MFGILLELKGLINPYVYTVTNHSIIVIIKSFIKMKLLQYAILIVVFGVLNEINQSICCAKL